MPYNGQGVFTPLITFQDNTEATAEDQNAQDGDLANGLSQALTRNGQGAATANISLGGFKLTNLAPGTAPTDAANFGQVSAATQVTRAVAITTSYPTTTTIINTNGYTTAGDGGAATYVRLNSTPGSILAGNFQSADGAYWAIVGFSFPIECFGGGTAVSDNSPSANSAIIWLGSIGGGVLTFGGGNYNFLGRIAIASSNIALLGGGIATLTFGASNIDCIVFGGQASQIENFTIRGFTINAAARFGGAAISINLAAYTYIEDVEILNPYNGIEHYITNTCTVQNVVLQLVRGHWGLYWHSPADGTGNSSGLTLSNIVVQSLYSGADGMWWDGFATTLNAFQLTFLGSRYGLWIKNTASSNAYFPQFGVFDNYVTDGASSIGTRIDGGAQFYFVNSFMQNTSIAPSTSGPQGGVDSNALYINGDIGNSYTNDLNFVNCRIGNCAQIPIVIVGARDVSFTQCVIADGSKAGANDYDAVYVYPNSQDVSFIGCKLTVWGSATNYRYGYFVSATTTRIKILGCEIAGWNTGPVYWANTDATSYCEQNVVSGTSNVLSEPKRTTPAAQTVSGSFTLSAAQMLGGILDLNGSPGSGFTATTATAAALVAACNQPFYFATFDLRIINTTSQICTLSAGSGVTLVGNLASATTLTVAAATAKTVSVVLTNPTPGSEAVTIYG